VVISRSVFPLLTRVVQSLSHDKTSTSVVVALLDSKNKVSVGSVSHMTGLVVENEDFLFFVMWSSN